LKGAHITRAQAEGIPRQSDRKNILKENDANYFIFASLFAPELLTKRLKQVAYFMLFQDSLI
jgi:hypothetical protein